MTFGNDPGVVETVTSMLLDSRAIYERYTTPLGLAVLHDPGAHYNPAPQRRHYYHRADSKGVGWDRSVATGSGYAGQYHPPVAQQYESAEMTPRDLLLSFHHLPYTHRLDDGKTLVQSLYDAYFEGVEQAGDLRRRWASLAGKIDGERHAQVLAKLTQQVEHAGVWRDTLVRFFHELSGIDDDRNRVRSDYRLLHEDEPPG